jgi:cell division septation protein DedD
MANDPMSRAPRFPFSRGNPQPEQGRRDYASRDLPPHAPLPRDPAPRPASTDPLSELARLIGQADFMNDPAPQAQPRDNRASGWPGSPPPQYNTGLPPLMPEYRDDRQQLPRDPYMGQPAAPAYVEPAPPNYDPRYAQQRPAQQPYAPQSQYGQGRADGPYYGDNGQLMQQDQYADDPYGYEDRRPRRRSGMIIVGAVLGLALAGTAGAYTYRTMFNGGMSGPPPLIKADTAPNKVVPAQTGAADSSGKQIFDRIGSNAGQGERVVSREETPVDVKATATRPSYPANAGQTATQWPNPPGTSSAPQAQTAAAPAGQPGSQSEPRKVRTIPIRPDQQGSAAQAAAPAQRATASSSAKTSANAPLSLTPQGAPAAPERVAAVSSTADSDTSSSAVPSGVGFMVQVSAQKSQAEANSAFKSAQSKYPNLLGSYQVVLRKKQTAKGTFYGAQVGPFESRDDASGLCAQLKTAGGNCLVEKN